MGFEAIIPHMTNNNTPSPFVVSTSNQLATYAPFNAFQDNGTVWISSVANSYIQIDLGRPYEVKKVYMDSVNRVVNSRVLTFTLQASGDGVHWITLYIGATTNYAYTEEKDFGAFRYWRITTNAMTSRGGVIRCFQLYSDDLGGFTNLKLNDIWVSDKPITLKGDITVSSDPVDIRVLINDAVVDDWMTYTSSSYSEYEYHPSLFTVGGNVISVQLRNKHGQIKESKYVLYKLDLEAYKFNPIAYDFKIKNSPAHARDDMWLSQSQPIGYLSAESGISYMFRYKPYAQMDGRIEDRPRLFERVMKDTYNIGEQQRLGIQRSNKTGIKITDILGDVRKAMNAIKSPSFSMAIEDARVIQQILYKWALIDTTRTGITLNDPSISIKKLKISDDVLNKHSLNSRRKQEIQNSISLLLGHEHSVKEEMIGIKDYYRILEEVHPRKESILATVMLGNMRDPVKRGHVTRLLTSSPINIEGHIFEHPGLTTKVIDETIVSEYTHSHREQEEQDGIALEGKIGSPIDARESQKLEHLIHFDKEEFIGIIETVLTPDKEEFIGIKQSMLNASVEDSIGIMDDILKAETTDLTAAVEHRFDVATKDKTKQAQSTEIVRVEKFRSFDVRMVSPFLVDKHIKTREIHRNEIMYIETGNVDAYIESRWQYTNLLSIEGFYEHKIERVEILSKDARVDTALINIDDAGIRGYVLGDGLILIDKNASGAGSDGDFIQNLDDLVSGARDLNNEIIYIEKAAKDIRIDIAYDSDNSYVEKHVDSKEGRPIFDTEYVDNQDRSVRPDVIYTGVDDLDKDAESKFADVTYIEKLSRNAFSNHTTLKNVTKLARDAFVLEVLMNIDDLDKASLILEHWDFATRIIDGARDLNEDALISVKHGKGGLVQELVSSDKELYFSYVYEKLLSDKGLLDSYLQDLIGADVQINIVRDDKGNSIKHEDDFADKQDFIGIINESINMHRINQEKEGFLPPNRFVLAQDESEWQDIWNKYSPGVDILDPPDTDFNYQNMGPAIYDMTTGVPKDPIGKSNKADVYVRAAMHHPLPENSTVGVDDTKRIIVDNYIFIDTVLALESIKSRNTLRYAGMPVGKTIKEVFSSLYAWIQQAAPGHKEYERMFRFARWYAEAVVLRQSKQVLHRIYNPWQSTLHRGTGLGVEHVKHGWMYMTAAGTLNTTTLSAKLTFSKENYIDSEFVLRGYFDNPTGQGTMEIKVDGIVVDSFKTHGIYQRKFEIPQGYHTYDISFVGTSGSAAISSIEVGGTVFVSAHTSSDDSDVNGLKALNELMAQLLGYFDLHHGDGKIKGTMEVRQRAVWNTHT